MTPTPRTDILAALIAWVDATPAVRAAVEWHARWYMHRLAAAVAQRNVEATIRRGCRKIGPVVALRRQADMTRDGLSGELHLDTEALLAETARTPVAC